MYTTPYLTIAVYVWDALCCPYGASHRVCPSVYYDAWSNRSWTLQMYTGRIEIILKIRIIGFTVRSGSVDSIQIEIIFKKLCKPDFTLGTNFCFTIWVFCIIIKTTSDRNSDAILRSGWNGSIGRLSVKKNKKIQSWLKIFGNSHWSVSLFLSNTSY